MIKQATPNNQLDELFIKMLETGQVKIKFDFNPRGLVRAFVHISFGSFIVSGFRVMTPYNKPYTKGEEVLLTPPCIPGSKSGKLKLIHFTNFTFWEKLSQKVLQQYAVEVIDNLFKFPGEHNLSDYYKEL